MRAAARARVTCGRIAATIRRLVGRSVAWSVGASAVASWLVVATIGTAVTASGAERGWAALAAALLVLAPAVLFGLSMVALVRWLGPPFRALAERSSLARFVDRDPHAPRGPVVMLHAAVLALGLWVALVAVGSMLLLIRLRSVESLELREGLSVAGLVLLATIAALLAAVSLWPLRSGLAALDRRVPLPLPASSSLRAVLWLGVPVSAGSALALRLLEPTFGPLALPLWITLALGVQCILHASLTSGPGRAMVARMPDPGRAWGKPAWLALGIALGIALALWSADRLLARSQRLSLALDRARPSSTLLGIARAASDLDRDGASALFGQHDCAPFSAKRGARLREIPGNGIDENCDGKDGERSMLPTSPTFFGQLSPAEVARYDVVWFIVDAVRADHTSLLGYEGQTTPHLEALASESLVFSEAYSQSSATTLSIPSMLMGVDPGRLVWILDDGGRLQVEKSQRRHIADMLQSKGYATGFVGSPYLRKRLSGLLHGWDWTGFTSGKTLDASTHAATLAIDFIVRARQKRDPFLLVTYLVAPHSPYDTHGPSYPKTRRGKRGRYDAEIMYADRLVSFVVDMLRADPERWAKTIVIVTSDHGEEFGEHGGSTHARTCHVESLHVPLLVRVPGQPAAVVDHHVGLVDVVPTVLELLGLDDEAPRGLDGSSLLLAVRAPERVSERPLFCTVVSQKASQGSFARRSVRAGKWKLMSELRGPGPSSLYDVEADPREREPVALEGPAARAAARMEEWLTTQLTGNAHQVEMSGD
jgi:arylsulfatase A-like enzyme